MRSLRSTSLFCLLLCYCGGSAAPNFDDHDARRAPIYSTEKPALKSLLACTDLGTANRSQQVAIVTADGSCAAPFVELLIARPADYLDAFYDLIATPATDALFIAVYAAMQARDFVFDDATISDLYTRLPAAIAACGASSRCADWNTFIVSQLDRGELYRCPDLATLSRTALLKVIPHGGYDCIEQLAMRVVPFVENTLVDTLRAGAATSSRPWARRNHLRVLGRLATGAPSSSRTLLISTRRSDVLWTLHGRLSAEPVDDPLHDIIWILDSAYYADLAAEATLETLSESTKRSSAIRFRALQALTRIYTKKGTLDAGDSAFLQRNARSDDSYLRAQIAFFISTISTTALASAELNQILDAIAAQYEVEPALVAKVYQARALDRHRGSTREATLRAVYEAAHLPNTLLRDSSTIQSGLPTSDLDALADLLDAERAVFATLLGGSPFDTPVAGDPNKAMTLIVFATPAEYREYMEAFVGAGRDAGGLYLERTGKLYTFARTAAESSFTLQELVQHEYGHYLQGRFVYPGMFGDPGDLTEPRGWADEGLAEVLAGLQFGAKGSYSMPPRATHLATLCGTTRRLGPLFDLRIGYDQPGTFDYAGGWSYVYFLLTTRAARAHDTYSAWRSRTYRRADAYLYAGASSLAELESAHQAALDGWCAARPLSLREASAPSLADPTPRSAHVPHLVDAP